jgi:hypothetical protein
MLLADVSLEGDSRWSTTKGAVMTARNELRAEVEIDADAATVWDVLMDFAPTRIGTRSSIRSRGTQRSGPAFGFGSSRRTAAG